MQRAFDLFEKVGDAVQIESRPKASEVARLHRERFAGERCWRAGQASPKRIVDHVAEGTPRSARERLQLGGDVFVQGEGGAHTVMLVNRHHGVNRQGLAARPLVSVDPGSPKK